MAFDALCLFCSLIWPFLFCYFGTITVERMERIANDAYDMKWYNYPISMQKFIILITMRSQKSELFSGLNLIPCTLEVFGIVSFIELITVNEVFEQFKQQTKLYELNIGFSCRFLNRPVHTILSLEECLLSMKVKFKLLQQTFRKAKR